LKAPGISFRLQRRIIHETEQFRRLAASFAERGMAEWLTFTSNGSKLTCEAESLRDGVVANLFRKEESGLALSVLMA